MEDVWVFGGANCGSDHHLLRTNRFYFGYIQRIIVNKLTKMYNTEHWRKIQSLTAP
jgi:hypothetical protein